MKILRTAFLVTLAVSPANAAIDPAATARKFANDFAIPRFQAVAATAHAQQDAWTQFCADTKRGDAKALTRSFGNLADAWAKVEFVRIGPASIALRVERFNWWLDRTNATGKALDAMLASDPKDLAPEKLATGSVAGQGLPVIERLLYDKGALAALKARDGARRCAVGEAVARGQTAIADAIVTDWTSASGAGAALAANTGWSGGAFADAKEAASVMMTDLVAGLERLKDLKAAMVFHDTTNPNAPKLAEGVRSGRTLRDISLNLAAIRQGLVGFLAYASAADKTRLDKAFGEARAALTALQQPKLKPAKRDVAVRRALGAFVNLSQTAMAVLPQATGLTLGFNSLDGD